MQCGLQEKTGSPRCAGQRGSTATWQTCEVLTSSITCFNGRCRSWLEAGEWARGTPCFDDWRGCFAPLPLFFPLADIAPVTSQSLLDICCCLGDPIAANPTQYTVEKAIERAALDWRFLTCEVSADEFGDAIRGIRALGFRGVYLDAPHKPAAVELVDELSDAARLSGVVNCICRDGDRLRGDNTEGRGLLDALADVFRPNGQRVMVIGANNMARSAVTELALGGAREVMMVADEQPSLDEFAGALAESTQVAITTVALSAGELAVDGDVGLLVQAVSDNLDVNLSAGINPQSLRADLVVADFALNPPHPQLLRDSAQAGCATVNGLELYVRQLAMAFALWTGVEPDREVMRDAVEEFLGV